MKRCLNVQNVDRNLAPLHPSNNTSAQFIQRKRKTTAVLQTCKVTPACMEKDGMPICRHCGAVFQRWSGLTKHITKKRCPFLPVGVDVDTIPPPPDTSQAPLVQNHEFLQRFQKHGLQALHRNPGISERARHHCTLCDQWVGCNQKVLVHIRKSHRPSSTKSSLACSCCRATVGPKSSHKCMVLLQVHLASLIHHGGRGPPGTDPSGAANLHRPLGQAEGRGPTIFQDGGGQAATPRLSVAPQNKGKGNKSKDQRSTATSSQQTDLINMMSRLVLRREDAISIARANQGYCLFLRTANTLETISKALYETSKLGKNSGVPSHPSAGILFVW